MNLEDLRDITVHEAGRLFGVQIWSSEERSGVKIHLKGGGLSAYVVGELLQGTEVLWTLPRKEMRKSSQPECRSFGPDAFLLIFRALNDTS